VHVDVVEWVYPPVVGGDEVVEAVLADGVNGSMAVSPSVRPDDVSNSR
jgi:hypothetical protein